MAIIVGHLVGQDPRLGRTGRALTSLGGQKRAQVGRELVGKGELRQYSSSAHQEEITCPENANIWLNSRDDFKPVLHRAHLGSLLLDGCQGERTGSQKLWGLGIGFQVERLGSKIDRHQSHGTAAAEESRTFGERSTGAYCLEFCGSLFFF